MEWRLQNYSWGDHSIIWRVKAREKSSCNGVSVAKAIFTAALAATERPWALFAPPWPHPLPLSLLAGPPQQKAHSWLRVFPIWSASTHTPRYLRGLCLTSFRPFLLKGALLNDAFFGFPSETSTQWRLLSPFPYPIFLYSNHHHLAYSTLLLFVLIIICVAR